MAGSDFSHPCITGYGSSPSRRGPLLGLNDHLLADLGLTRADIQGVVWGVVPVTAVAEAPEASAEVIPLPAPAPRRLRPDPRIAA